MWWELCARLWTAFYSLSPLHRIILQYAVLREMTKTEMRLRISAAHGKRFAVRVDEETEYEIALSVLRARFLKEMGAVRTYRQQKIPFYRGFFHILHTSHVSIP